MSDERRSGSDRRQKPSTADIAEAFEAGRKAGWEAGLQVAKEVAEWWDSRWWLGLIAGMLRKGPP